MKPDTMIDKNKFIADSLLNLMGFFFLGVSGIIINMVIGRYYSAHDLGVFNQVYAIYVLFSQLAAAGMQVSVLKHVAQHNHRETRDKIISSALYVTIVSGTLFVVLLYFFRGVTGWILNSPDVVAAIPYVLVGLWCFALNKLFMGILNGLEKMKAYAIFTALRGIGFIIGIFAAVYFKLEGYKLPLVCTITESSVLLAIALYCKGLFTFATPRQCVSWMREHLLFGVKSLSVGLITELNTRIDVLVLGIFVSDRIVGIYSMAAMVIEGVAQIPFVLRRIFDPKLTKLIYGKQADKIKALVRKGALRMFLGMLPLCIAAVLLYPVAIRFLTGNPDFEASWKVFAILAAGLVIQSGYIPFSGMLVQGGYPGYQSLFVLLVCVTNTVLNFILIPFFGITGAATATAVSFVFFVLYFKIFVFRVFKLKV
ncbi:MAG: flippase [bacterium]|nr:flippase [bacterium]